jgi:MoaA/NifB/PqqE/SkfB family radical SAM enzyme
VQFELAQALDLAIVEQSASPMHDLLRKPIELYQRLRYSPFLCQLVVTRRCNLSCAYCTEFDQSSAPVPLDELRRRIDDVARLGSFGLELTGGEPLLHPDLGKLVAHASRYRFQMLGLISNGFLLEPAIVDELNAAGLTDLQISVDGVVPNAITMKVLKPLRPKLEMLARRARFKVVLSAVVGSGAPFDEVAEVVRFARDHGFRPRVLLIHDPDGQLALSPQDLRSYREIQRMIGRHWKDLRDYRDRLIEGGTAPFRCRAGSRYLYIDEHGVVHRCAQTMERFGKPLAEYTALDLRRQYSIVKGCNAACTIGCARSCSQVDFLFPQDDDDDARRV